MKQFQLLPAGGSEDESGYYAREPWEPIQRISDTKSPTRDEKTNRAEFNKIDDAEGIAGKRV